MNHSSTGKSQKCRLTNGTTNVEISTEFIRGHDLHISDLPDIHPFHHFLHPLHRS